RGPPAGDENDDRADDAHAISGGQRHQGVDGAGPMLLEAHYVLSGLKRAERRRDSVPMAFDVDPATRTLLPAARHPGGARARARDIVAFSPDVFAAVISPVTRLPLLDLDALTRQDGDDLDTRRRRRRRHVYLRLELGHGRNGQQASARGDCKTTQQTAAA